MTFLLLRLKHHDQGNLQRGELTSAYGSRGWESVLEERHRASGIGQLTVGIEAGRESRDGIFNFKHRARAKSNGSL